MTLPTQDVIIVLSGYATDRINSICYTVANPGSNIEELRSAWRGGTNSHSEVKSPSQQTLSLDAEKRIKQIVFVSSENRELPMYKEDITPTKIP